MKLLDKLFRRKSVIPEGLTVTHVSAGPVMPELNADQANALHKILHFKSMPMFSAWSADQMVEHSHKTFGDLHFGNGCTDDLIRYGWSGQYEADKKGD